MQGISFLADYADFLYSADSDTVKRFAASMNANQYKSKKWLFERLHMSRANAETTIIIGGWYGTYLVPMLMTLLKPKKVFFIEKDPHCIEVAKLLHKEAQKNATFEFINWDAIEQSKEISKLPASLIINTACEHMEDMSAIRSPKNSCVYALQSTNSTTDPGHINPSENIDQFLAKTGIIQFSYKDSLQINNKTRHMIIGTKSIF